MLNGSLTNSNNFATLTYVWKADGVQVGTEENYTVTEEDLGEKITHEIQSDEEVSTIVSGATEKVMNKVVPNGGVPEVVVLVQ